VPSAKIEDFLFRKKRDQFQEEIDFPAGHIFIADRSGIGREVDFVEELLPPFRVDAETHGPSG
jgi:hypothetical protein